MNKLTDAVIFSKKYSLDFNQCLLKENIEVLFKQLMQEISKPLAHNDILLGHIKLIASISEEEFMFSSVTKVDSINTKFSSKWLGELAGKVSNINLDINVLIYGYKREMIEQTVADALSNLRHVSIVN